MKLIVAFLFILFYNKSYSQNSWHDVDFGLHGGTGLDMAADTLNNKLYITGGVNYAGSNNVFSVQAVGWDGYQYSVVGCSTGLDLLNINMPNTIKYINGYIYAGFTASSGYIMNDCLQTYIGNTKAKYSNGVWDTIGTFWTGEVSSIASFQGQPVFAGSNFSIVNSGTTNDIANSIALWDGNHWQVLGSNGNNGLVLSNHPIQDVVIQDMIEFNGELFVSGTFDWAGGITLNNFGIARWNGTTWQEAGTTNIYKGYFGIYNNELYLANWPGGDIFKWTGTDWVLFAQTDITPGNALTSILEYQGKLVVAGHFSSINGVPCNNIAMWDGNQWDDMQGGAKFNPNQPGVGVYSAAVFQNSLYIGGVFNSVGNNLVVDNIARWGPLTSIPENYKEKKLEIYPNPATSTIQIKNNSKNEIVTITDLAGKIIIQSNSSEVDVSLLKDGMYLITSEDVDGRKITGKFVKE